MPGQLAMPASPGTAPLSPKGKYYGDRIRPEHGSKFETINSAIAAQVAHGKLVELARFAQDGSLPGSVPLNNWGQFVEIFLAPREPLAGVGWEKRLEAFAKTLAGCSHTTFDRTGNPFSYSAHCAVYFDEASAGALSQRRVILRVFPTVAAAQESLPALKDRVDQWKEGVWKDAAKEGVVRFAPWCRLGDQVNFDSNSRLGKVQAALRIAHQDKLDIVAVEGQSPPNPDCAKFYSAAKLFCVVPRGSVPPGALNNWIREVLPHLRPDNNRVQDRDQFCGYPAHVELIFDQPLLGSEGAPPQRLVIVIFPNAMSARDGVTRLRHDVACRLREREHKPWRGTDGMGLHEVERASCEASE